MIKSKIDAREKALSLAVTQTSAESAIRLAEIYERYLVGNANLPETEPTVEEVTNKAIERMVAVYSPKNQSLSGMTHSMGLSGDFPIDWNKIDR